jgi:hypothetical protein
MKRLVSNQPTLAATVDAARTQRPDEAVIQIEDVSLSPGWSVSIHGTEFTGAAAAADAGLKVTQSVRHPSPGCSIIELLATNKSDREINLTQMEPLRCLKREGVGFPFAAGKCLTNGYIYYDSGSLIDFAPGKAAAVESFWNAAFYRADPRSVVVVGYLNNDRAEGRIVA